MPENRKRSQSAQNRSQKPARPSSGSMRQTQMRGSRPNASSGIQAGQGARRPNRPQTAKNSGQNGDTRRPSASQARHSQKPAAKRAPANTKRPQSAPPKRQPRKRKPHWGRIIVALIALCACVALAIFIMGAVTEKTEETTVVTQSVSEPLVSDDDKAGFDATINSDSAILINADNGDVLYEKDADTQRAPASLVKLMTVYVAIKHNDNIDRELSMPEAAYDGLEEGSASQSGLKEGETVTLRDLLYAAILSSGGDAANALALATSGNIDSFVELMNEEAAALGLDSTIFTNPTGLDDDGQVSTCRDMARLVKGALGNGLFKEVFLSQEYTTTASDEHPDGLALSHTMSKDLTSFQRYFDTSGYAIVGGKTGYTADSGNCLASLAQKEGAPSYIVCTMHATGTGDQYYQAVHDAVTLYGEAYERDSREAAETEAKRESAEQE